MAKTINGTISSRDLNEDERFPEKWPRRQTGQTMQTVPTAIYGVQHSATATPTTTTTAAAKIIRSLAHCRSYPDCIIRKETRQYLCMQSVIVVDKVESGLYISMTSISACLQLVLRI